MDVLLGSVWHHVKIHNITPVTGKERGDLEIKDYLVMQKPEPQANRLPPPHTLIMDYTTTHTRFGLSHVHHMVQLTNIRRLDGDHDPDGAWKDVGRIKIQHYRNLYLNHPDPIVFIPLVVDTTVLLYDELFVTCSSTLTVQNRFLLMTWQRNRTSFASFELRVSQFWRVLSVW